MQTTHVLAPLSWWLLVVLAGVAVWRIVQEDSTQALLPEFDRELQLVSLVPASSPLGNARGDLLPVDLPAPLSNVDSGGALHWLDFAAEGPLGVERGAHGNVDFGSAIKSDADDVGAEDVGMADSIAAERFCNDVHPNADDPNMLHVVFASDLSQAEGVQASVASVVTSSATPDSLTVHIMVQARWAKDFKQAFGLRPECMGAVTVTGVLIRIHEVEGQLIERSVAKVPAAIKKERGAIDTLENFARFYMHEVLDRASVVIYLDADTIVQADLGQLRKQLIASNKTAGFVAREQNVLMDKFLRKKKNCNLRKTDSPKNLSANWPQLLKKPAFNVGVFAVNLHRWKSTGAVERVERLVAQHNACKGGLWVGGSQPPLLLAFHHRLNAETEDFVVFDASWNAVDLGWFTKFEKEKLKAKSILHWNGNKKPWRTDGLYKDLWRPHWDRFQSLLQPFTSADSAEAISPAETPAAPQLRRRRRETTTVSPVVRAAAAACPHVQLVSEWTDGSGSPCEIGRTFGCTADNRSMWVKSGCSGAFFVRGSMTSCASAGAGDRRSECKSGALTPRERPCGLQILTTFFTTKKDWQRGKYAKAQFDKIGKLYVSALRRALRVMVLYDELPQDLIFQYSTDFFRFHRVNLSDFDMRYGVNDLRYFFFQRLVKEHTEWSSVFIVDAFDVRVGMDPCESIKPETLYVGVELDKLRNHPWMKARFFKMGGKYKKWYTSMVDAKMKILNCGITGGSRDIMLSLLQRMTEVITDPNLAPNRNSEDVNLNMAALNYIVYTEFRDKYVGGVPVHSLYKRFQNKRTDVWFIHK